jgi:hypothetical protein
MPRAWRRRDDGRLSTCRRWLEAGEKFNRRRENFMNLGTRLLPAALTALLMWVAPAQASTSWNFSFADSGGLISASGTFVTAGDASSPEPITSITGSYSEFGVSYTIVDVAAAGDTSAFFYDNLFSATAPYFTGDGLVFYVGLDSVGDPLFVNLYYFADGSEYVTADSDTGEFFSAPVTVTITVGETTPPAGPREEC